MAGPDLAAVVARMSLVHADAKTVLPGLKPDVVIVDPMHPPRQSSALTRQQMRLLRLLVGSDPDALELIQIAIASARKRVVLKWPLRHRSLEGLPKATYQIRYRTVRYDVFVTPQSSEVSGA
jgi:16S rRNA (guanine1516-N2)-methyltransferase